MNKNLCSLIYHILNYKKIYITLEKIKDISNDCIICQADYEYNAKCFFNSLNLIFHNYQQPFNKELINQSYFLLTNELIDSSILDKVIELYYKNIDVAPHSLAALLHLYIMNNVEKNNIEFAFIVSNYVMLKKKRWFIMPYEYCHNDYREAVAGNDLSSLIRIFYDIELVKKEKKACLLSRDEVIQKIKYLKKDLMDTYNIKNLYLFGSFAKGNNTDKSDLDFIVIFNESLINKEKNYMIKKVKEYFMTEFNCDVDLLDFSYALDTFDKSQMEYLITLI